MPSNVSVTPYINGVPQPTKTCTVSRSEFTSIATISGSVSICTPATSSSYSIANLGVGNTIAWSSSNTAVATVSATTGNNITVNKVSDGTFYLIARITNPCGQFVDIPKLVRFGGAPIFVVSSGWIPQQPNISRISMISVDPNIPLSAEGITATTWIEKLANGTTRDCKTGTGLFTATVLYNSQYVTVTATNSCGTSTQVINILDLFGQGLKFIQSNTVSSKVLFKTFPNPSKGIINIEIENTELSTTTKNIEAQLYDMMGQLRTKVEIIDNKATFNVRDYPKGLYFLKINIDGEIVTKQIIIE